MVGGVGMLTAPGETMFEKMKYFEANADWFRLLMLREPRGYPRSCVNVLLPPTEEESSLSLSQLLPRGLGGIKLPGAPTLSDVFVADAPLPLSAVGAGRRAATWYWYFPGWSTART